MRIVLDTNVLVSGMISTGTPPARLLDWLRAGKLQLVIDDRIVAEYADVLSRDELRDYFPASAAEDVMEFLRRDSERVHSTVVIRELPDPGDIPFLEVALTASVPLVTGNKKHFPAAIAAPCRVQTPREFLHSLAGGVS